MNRDKYFSKLTSFSVKKHRLGSKVAIRQKRITEISILLSGLTIAMNKIVRPKKNCNSAAYEFYLIFFSEKRLQIE